MGLSDVKNNAMFLIGDALSKYCGKKSSSDECTWMSNVTTGAFPEGGNHDYYVSFTNGEKNIFSLMCKENGNKLSCDLYKDGNKKVADTFDPPSWYKPIYYTGQAAWYLNPLTLIPTIATGCDGGAQYNTVPHGHGSTDVSVETYLPDVVGPRDTIPGDTEPGDTFTPEDVEDALDAVGDVFEDAGETIGDALEDAGDILGEVVEVVGDAIEEVSPDVADAIEEVSPDVADAIEEVGPEIVEETIIYEDVPDMPLLGINFSINPAGDQCYAMDSSVTSACVALLSDGELNVADFFNSANSPMPITIDKLDGGAEPAKFDVMENPVMSQFTQLETTPGNIFPNKIIWSIYKYTVSDTYPELDSVEDVGSVRAETVMTYDPNEGAFVQSYVLYIKGEAKIDGNWYDCEWKYPATEDAPEDCSAY